MSLKPLPGGSDSGQGLVLIGNRHRIVRDLVRALLGDVPGLKTQSAASHREVLVRYEVDHPDVVLLDDSGQDHDGMDTIRQLICLHPGARVVMLLTDDGGSGQAEAVGAGAVGSLPANASGEELCAAVTQALTQQDLLAPTLRRALTRRASRESDLTIGLTSREMQVLLGISAGKTNAEIGTELSVTTDTIKTHCRRLFRKLDVKTRAAAVTQAMRRGFLR